MQKKVVKAPSIAPHSGFYDLPPSEMMSWCERAVKFVEKQGWTYTEFDRTELMFGVAVFLYYVSSKVNQATKYPLYVVHSADNDWRFETASYQEAFEIWKKRNRHGERVALFHWEHKDHHVKRFASEDYPFSKDYGGKV